MEPTTMAQKKNRMIGSGILMMRLPGETGPWTSP